MNVTGLNTTTLYPTRAYSPGIQGLDTAKGCKVAIQQNNIRQLADLVPQLLEDAKTTSNIGNDRGQTPQDRVQYAKDMLLICALNSGNIQALQELLSLGVCPAPQANGYGTVQCHPLYAACLSSGTEKGFFAREGWPEGLEALCVHLQTQGISLDDLQIEHAFSNVGGQGSPRYGGQQVESDEFLAWLYTKASGECKEVLKRFTINPELFKTRMQKKAELEQKIRQERLETQQKLCADFLGHIQQGTLPQEELEHCIKAIKPAGLNSQEHIHYHKTIQQALTLSIQSQNLPLLKGLLKLGLDDMRGVNSYLSPVQQTCDQGWAAGLSALCSAYLEKGIHLDRLVHAGEQLGQIDAEVSIYSLYHSTSPDCQKVIEANLKNRSELLFIPTTPDRNTPQPSIVFKHGPQRPIKDPSPAKAEPHAIPLPVTTPKAPMGAWGKPPVVRNPLVSGPLSRPSAFSSVAPQPKGAQKADLDFPPLAKKK